MRYQEKPGTVIDLPVQFTRIEEKPKSSKNEIVGIGEMAMYPETLPPHIIYLLEAFDQKEIVTLIQVLGVFCREIRLCIEDSPDFSIDEILSKTCEQIRDALGLLPDRDINNFLKQLHLSNLSNKESLIVYLRAAATIRKALRYISKSDESKHSAARRPIPERRDGLLLTAAPAEIIPMVPSVIRYELKVLNTKQLSLVLKELQTIDKEITISDDVELQHLVYLIRKTLLKIKNNTSRSSIVFFSQFLLPELTEEKSQEQKVTILSAKVRQLLSIVRAIGAEDTDYRSG